MNKYFWPLLSLLLSIATIVILLVLGYSHLHKKYRGYYESGAHAVALHHTYRGTYGSRAYRDAAFEWGDPQDEEDLNEIYRYMFEHDKNAWLMYDAGGEWLDPNDERLEK